MGIPKVVFSPNRQVRLVAEIEYLQAKLKKKDATLKETEDRLDWALRKVDQLLQGEKV